MTDREIFQKNLNYYLAKYGKLQKDLAEYVGAKATTVSGWTRGISYPRVDKMEKIAMFFGIPTSKLTGEHLDSEFEAEDPEISIVSGMMEDMTKEQKQQVIDLIRILIKKG